MKTGIELITEERERQITVEGFDAENDTAYTDGQLVEAALCYTAQATNELSEFNVIHGSGVPYAWPWSRSWWKPGTKIRNLTKAGALIAAEIDRLHALEDAK